ncbi:hypothetical protein HZS92_01816 [Xanthomonas citri pv. citri]|nr:hypothetical protein HZS92_01816 [Xanthomonas citri pv. citri]
MYVEVSAKRPVARRDKACAAAQAGRPGKARNAVSARHRALPGGLAVSGTERAPRGLPWRQPRRRHAAPAPHRRRPTHLISTCITRSKRLTREQPAQATAQVTHALAANRALS